jgi:hypothetical protein
LWLDITWDASSWLNIAATAALKRDRSRVLGFRRKNGCITTETSKLKATAGAVTKSGMEGSVMEVESLASNTSPLVLARRIT